MRITIALAAFASCAGSLVSGEPQHSWPLLLIGLLALHKASPPPSVSGMIR